MAVLIWDASALVKQYALEPGSETVQALFRSAPPHETATTIWGYAEAFSILLRHLNRGTISSAAFSQAIASLRIEILDDPHVSFLAIDDTIILAGIALIQAHNLNSVDAALLASILRFARARSPQLPRCVLVAADQRLLRAARAEGLTVVDPEQLAAVDVPAFLTSL